MEHCRDLIAKSELPVEDKPTKVIILATQNYITDVIFSQTKSRMLHGKNTIIEIREADSSPL